MLTLLAASLIVSQTPDAPRCVTVVGNSDLHGMVEPHVMDVGGVKLRYGGLVAMGAYVEALRAKHGERLVVLDAGDAFQGTLVSNLSRGAAVVAAYNAIGVRALAIGNHEFDYGPVTPGDPDRRGVLKQLTAKARFPFLAINIYDAATHRRVVWPNAPASMLFDAGGVKVGVIGVATVDTPKVTKVINIPDLEFRDPVPLLIAESRQLRARGAEIVVAVGHVGGKCEDLRNPQDLKSCDRDQELMRILEALPPGVLDVAVGGHTHQTVGHWINGVATIQGGARGKMLAQVTACVAPGGGIDRKTSVIHPLLDLCLDEWVEGGCRSRKVAGPTRPAQFDGKPLAIPQGLKETLQPFLDETAAAQVRPIGATLPAPLGREGGTSLGNIVAESMRVAVSANVGVQNLGGVRADLTAGRVTFGQIYEVLPFDNQVVAIVLTGAQLKQFIEHLSGRRGEMPYLAGLVVSGKPGKLEYKTADGAAIVDTQRYKVATNDFLVQGGEGLGVIFDAVPAADRTETGLDMRDALIALLRQRYPAGEPPRHTRTGLYGLRGSGT
jgi:5'-nucleotidase